MPTTFDSRRLRHERTIDRRLTEAHRGCAVAIGQLVQRSPSSRNMAGVSTITNTLANRTALKAAAWGIIKQFYIGTGLEPFIGQEPQSPYTRLLYEGIAGAVRIQAERQVALLRRVIHDEQVFRWLTGARAVRTVTELVYDPFHLFVDPNGYRLSDRVWRTSIDVRSRVDLLLDYEISQGTSAVRIAELLEDFLTPGAGSIRTRTPYGREGSYSARRLARTEITAAAGRATINASQANPFVQGVQWVLSGSHPRMDPCDINARGGPNGDGIYPPESVPPYPEHPHCKCHLSPVALGSTADLVTQLRGDIRNQTLEARRMQGIFNLDFMVQALLSGLITDVVERMAA